MIDTNIDFIENNILNDDHGSRNINYQHKSMNHKKKVNYQNDINDYIRDNQNYIKHLKGDCICLVCNCGQCKCNNRHSYKRFKSLIRQSTNQCTYKLPQIIHKDLKRTNDMNYTEKIDNKYLFTETTNKVDYQKYSNNERVQQIKINDNIDNRNQLKYKYVSSYQLDYQDQKQIDKSDQIQHKIVHHQVLKDVKFDPKTQYNKCYNQTNRPLRMNSIVKRPVQLNQSPLNVNMSYDLQTTKQNSYKNLRTQIPPVVVSPNKQVNNSFSYPGQYRSESHQKYRFMNNNHICQLKL